MSANFYIGTHLTNGNLTIGSMHPSSATHLHGGNHSSIDLSGRHIFINTLDIVLNITGDYLEIRIMVILLF